MGYGLSGDTPSDGGGVQGETDKGGQGAHLDPLRLFLTHLRLFSRGSIPFIWRVLSAFPPA
jgi:hypothetical protein